MNTASTTQGSNMAHNTKTLISLQGYKLGLVATSRNGKRTVYKKVGVVKVSCSYGRIASSAYMLNH